MVLHNDACVYVCERVGDALAFQMVAGVYRYKLAKYHGSGKIIGRKKAKQF